MLFFKLLAAGLTGLLIGYILTDRNLLNSINKKLCMAQETLDQLTQKVDGLETRLTNIAADITRIKEGLPATGGLSAAEVATLSSRLDAAVAKAQALDEENEPEETPTEPI